MMYCKKANKACYYTEQCHDLPLEFLPACKDFEPTETYNKEVEEKDEERRKSQEKYEQKKRSEILGEFAKEIGRDRLKEICEAVRLIGQEVYEVIGNRIETYTVTNIGVEEECVSVNIERPVHDGMIEDGFEIGDEDIHNIFHGDNAKERAEARLKELRR